MTAGLAPRPSRGSIDRSTVTGAEPWIVCLDELRPIGPNGVACPLRPGAPVALATCLDCHLLVTLSAERSTLGWCATDDLG